MRRAGTRLIDWAAVREIAHRRLGRGRRPDPGGPARGGGGLLPRDAAAHRADRGRRDRIRAARRTGDSGRGRSAPMGRPQPRHLPAAVRAHRAHAAGQPGGPRHGRPRDVALGEPHCRQPAARLHARLPGPQGARPVRRQPAGGRAGPRSPPFRGAEHRRHGSRHAGAEGRVPHLHRPPRGDPCLRVRGARLAASVLRRAGGGDGRAAGGRVRRPDGSRCARRSPAARATGSSGS